MDICYYCAVKVVKMNGIVSIYCKCLLTEKS